MTNKTPTEIIAALAPMHRKILEEVLKIEKSLIHERDIQVNVAKERQAVESVQQAICRAVPDED